MTANENSLSFMYSRSGEMIVPHSPVANGWNPKLQSGHAVAPLLASLIESVPALVSMISSRAVINITRPVPMEPLTSKVEVLREGKKLQVIKATLIHNGLDVADMTVLRTRCADSPVVASSRHYPPIGECTLLERKRFPNGFEIRVVEGSRKKAAVAAWLKMHIDLFQGEPISAFSRLFSLIDFGSAINPALSMNEWSFPNVDMSAHLFREPVGEWTMVDTETESAGLGVSLVSTVLADQVGVFGRAHQTLIVDPSNY